MASIWWIKRDFRLHDNDALTAALESHDTVTPVFVFETGLTAQPDYSAMHVYAWHQALGDLRSRLQSIGSDVYIQCGEAETVFNELHERIQFDTVYSMKKLAVAGPIREI